MGVHQNPEWGQRLREGDGGLVGGGTKRSLPLPFASIGPTEPFLLRGLWERSAICSLLYCQMPRVLLFSQNEYSTRALGVLSVIENTAYKTLPHWFCRTVKVWESFCRRGLFEYLSLICSSIRGCECHSTGHYAQAHAALGQKNL